ncbi:hypothetical protein ABZ725_28760 [Streptomyces sp. NPDC006872]|uniref:hypothetical protein n=1 Tax=Streptomyces sp. NPDC006872 TaxID=3155720 RepID=UPI0033CFAB37
MAELTLICDRQERFQGEIPGAVANLPAPALAGTVPARILEGAQAAHGEMPAHLRKGPEIVRRPQRRLGRAVKGGERGVGRRLDDLDCPGEPSAGPPQQGLGERVRPRKLADVTDTLQQFTLRARRQTDRHVVRVLCGRDARKYAQHGGLVDAPRELTGPESEDLLVARAGLPAGESPVRLPHVDDATYVASRLAAGPRGPHEDAVLPAAALKNVIHRMIFLQAVLHRYGGRRRN